jgi:hypothetical protein
VVHPEVLLQQRDGRSFSQEVVEVFADEQDIVHVAVRAPATG